jgi:hypothetical protein
MEKNIWQRKKLDTLLAIVKVTMYVQVSDYRPD